MTMKKIQTISYKEDGTLVINPNGDAANSDPIRAARLKRSDAPEDKKKLEKLEDTPMVKSDPKT